MKTPNKSTVLLNHHLKALKLPTVLREYPALAQLCAQERSSYPEYLLGLTERELIDREQRAAQRRLKAAFTGPPRTNHWRRYLGATRHPDRA